MKEKYFHAISHKMIINYISLIQKIIVLNNKVNLSNKIK